MAFRIVPTLLVVGSAGVTAGGVAAGTVGGRQIIQAANQIESQTAMYDERHRAHLAKVDHTNTVLRALRDSQERAEIAVISRAEELLEQQPAAVRAAGASIAGSAKVNPAVVSGHGAGAVANLWVVGSKTPDLLKAAATRFGKASTGRRIALLHGVAAEDATKALFGGGSVSSGGGGTALGVPLLNTAKASVYVGLLGVAVKVQGTAAGAVGRKHGKQLEAAVTRLDDEDQILRVARKRARELGEILATLKAVVVERLDSIDVEQAGNDVDDERVQEVLTLVTALQEVAAAQVIDATGSLDERTPQVIATYRETGTAAVER
ncbi:hypothetical protein [Agromyces humi]|uniref:hypothetical protein n=1 Tax=Agromyces humi TaxID=1766800 RepID=UPI00135A2D92|nr:hypothetical protein [Agromyces humi]